MTDSQELSENHKKLLSLIQSGYPIATDPYEVLGQELGLVSDEVFTLFCELREGGLIRRMGPVFDSYRLGYVSTLCATSIPESKVDEVAAFINQYYQVTHNYLRENAYNIWFTVIAYGDEELQDIVSAIEEFAQAEVLQLPALRLFKIKVDFNVLGNKREAHKAKTTVPREVTPVDLSEDDKSLIRAVQSYGFKDRHPFKELAILVNGLSEAEFTEDGIIERFRTWKEQGAIRRFGATLRHHKVGMSSNVMVVWNIPEEQIEEAGRIMSEQDEVSHCYERPRFPTWPSNVYTMIHGKTRQDCENAIVCIQKALAKEGIIVEEPQRLFTRGELKKTSMRYFSGE